MPKAQPGTVTELTAFYDMGARSLREQPALPRRSYAHLPEDEQRRIKSEAERLLKARTFADPRKGYSLREFHALIAQCQTGGFVLGTSLITRLLGVPKGKPREKLQAAAIGGRWTWAQLCDAIEASGMTTKHARQGRTVPRPNTLKEALVMITADTAMFQKRAKAILDSSHLTELPKVVEVGLEKAVKEMMKLERTAAKFIW